MIAANLASWFLLSWPTGTHQNVVGLGEQRWWCASAPPLMFLCTEPDGPVATGPGLPARQHAGTPWPQAGQRAHQRPRSGEDSGLWPGAHLHQPHCSDTMCESGSARRNLACSSICLVLLFVMWACHLMRDRNPSQNVPYLEPCFFSGISSRIPGFLAMNRWLWMDMSLWHSHKLGP